MKACENPFATDRVERLLAFRTDWAGTTWEVLEQRWEKLGRRAALTGRHGAGKTTLLAAWMPRLRARGHQVLPFFLNREQPALEAEHWQQLAACPGKIVILDGEEQLSSWQRRKLHRTTRQAAGLLVTRHRPGRLPTLLHLAPPLELLHRCVRRLAPAHYPQLAPHLAGWWRDHRGNLREILLRCYDQV